MSEATGSNEVAVLNKLDLDYWQKRWKEQKIGWHRDEVNNLLRTHHHEMTTKPDSRVFFPLCGKTVDMRYMAERGYDVIGVEYTKQAIIDFFAEQQLQYTTDDVNDDFTAYVAAGKKITIYNGDFFKVTPELLGPEELDGIWDRGSLVAMNPDDRGKYARVIASLMTSQTRYMIAALSYDQSKHGGPPFSVPREVVRELFGADFSIEEKYEAPNEYSMNRFKLDWWLDSLYLLVRK